MKSIAAGWKELVDTVTDVRAYKNVVRSMFEDGIVNEGRLSVLRVFTKGVCDQISKSDMTEKFITDSDGATLRVMDYHGHLTQPFPGIGDRFDALPNLTVRHDDAVVVGYPKSGNHWVWELANRIKRNNTGVDFSTYLPDHMIEARTDDVLNAQVSPRVLITHLPPFLLSKCEKLFDGKHKIIYIVRNPKDVAVSFYTQTYNFRPLYGYDGQWSGFFDLFLNGMVDSGSWFDHVLMWEKYKAEHPEIPIHLVHYEDLKEDLMAEILKLGDFLDENRGQSFYDQLYKRSLFPAMKNNHDNHAKKELKKLYRNGEVTMFRKGIIGDWKNVFTDSQSERLDAMLADKMRDSKLNIRFEARQN